MINVQHSQTSKDIINVAKNSAFSLANVAARLSVDPTAKVKRAGDVTSNQSDSIDDLTTTASSPHGVHCDDSDH